MKRSTRRVIFYISIALFLLVCVAVLFYAQGYDFDLTNGHISKTGGVSLGSNISAEVYLDGVLVGNTSLLQRTFSQSRLLPGKHQIELKRQDYQSWHKEFSVGAGFVVDLGEAYLPRTQAITEILLPDFKLISYSPAGEFVAGWVGSDLVFYDLNKQRIAVTVPEKEAINQAKLSVLWSGDNQNALVYDSKYSWLVDFGAQTYQSINIPRIFLSDSAELLANRVYTLGSEKSNLNNLIYFDLNKTSISTLNTGVKSFLVDNESLFFTNVASSTIWQVKSGQANELSDISLPTGAKLIKVLQGDNATLILTSTGLYRLDGNKKLERVTDDADDFALSPDQSTLVWSSNEEAWLMILKDTQLHSGLAIGKPALLFRKGEPIDNLFWLDNQYLYLTNADGLDLLEAVSQTEPVDYHLINKDSQVNSIVLPAKREKLIWLNSGRLESAEF